MALGLGLMIINRLSGLVLPTTTKYLMDDVISQGHWELLPTLAMAAGTATLVDASTAFANSQVLGVAAQRAITEMRKDIEAHVMRLPIRYFDSTKSGILISRIMTDAEGIRNLVGTGLVQAHGIDPHRIHRDVCAALPELEADDRHHPDPRRVRRWHGHRLQASAATLPREGPNQR
jgi:ABC-type multidrug transport system fused ATPase/permease subunit